MSLASISAFASRNANSVLSTVSPYVPSAVSSVAFGIKGHFLNTCPSSLLKFAAIATVVNFAIGGYRFSEEKSKSTEAPWKAKAFTVLTYLNKPVTYASQLANAYKTALLAALLFQLVRKSSWKANLAELGVVSSLIVLDSHNKKKSVKNTLNEIEPTLLLIMSLINLHASRSLASLTKCAILAVPCLCSNLSVRSEVRKALSYVWNLVPSSKETSESDK